MLPKAPQCSSNFRVVDILWQSKLTNMAEEDMERALGQVPRVARGRSASRETGTSALFSLKLCVHTFSFGFQSLSKPSQSGVVQAVVTQDLPVAVELVKRSVRSTKRPWVIAVGLSLQLKVR